MKKILISLSFIAFLFCLSTTTQAEITTNTENSVVEFQESTEEMINRCALVLCPDNTVCVEKNGLPQCIPHPTPPWGS